MGLPHLWGTHPAGQGISGPIPSGSPWLKASGRASRTRKDGHDSQLCTSNPEVIEKLAQGMVETLWADPTIEVISLTPNDGGGFCECKKCEALDGPPRGNFKRKPGQQTQPWSYSNRFAIMDNEVARRVAKVFPKVKIKVGAYAYYLSPPDIKDFRMEPNILVADLPISAHSRSIAEQVRPRWPTSWASISTTPWATLAGINCFGRWCTRCGPIFPGYRDRGVKELLHAVHPTALVPVSSEPLHRGEVGLERRSGRRLA